MQRLNLSVLALFLNAAPQHSLLVGLLDCNVHLSPLIQTPFLLPSFQPPVYSYLFLINPLAWNVPIGKMPRHRCSASFFYLFYFFLPHFGPETMPVASVCSPVLKLAARRMRANHLTHHVW